jgi:hypothetical protein
MHSDKGGCNDPKLSGADIEPERLSAAIRAEQQQSRRELGHLIARISLTEFLNAPKGNICMVPDETFAAVHSLQEMQIVDRQRKAQLCLTLRNQTSTRRRIGLEFRKQSFITYLDHSAAPRIIDFSQAPCQFPRFSGAALTTH